MGRNQRGVRLARQHADYRGIHAIRASAAGQQSVARSVGAECVQRTVQLRFVERSLRRRLHQYEGVAHPGDVREAVATR